MKKNSLFRGCLLGAVLVLNSFAFTSCGDDNDGPAGAYAEDGVFVVNEGSFGTPSGSISYYNSNSKEVQNDIFSNENDSRPLGDVVQNMVIHNDRAYIVANNSNKIEVVNAVTFKSEGVIEGLQLPRYFTAQNSSKGYVTEWVDFGSGQVSVLDLTTNTVTKTIAVGVMPEQLLLVNDKLFVANSGDNTITVINTATDAVEKNITVTSGPNSFALDKNNVLWVISTGNKDWTLPESEYTAGALTSINSSNGTVVNTFPFPKATALADKLTINGAKEMLYYNYDGKVYQQPITSGSLSHTMLIDHSFYGLGVDPETGYIYGGDAGNFSSNGTVYIYKPDGTPAGNFTAGIAPNGFTFN